MVIFANFLPTFDNWNSQKTKLFFEILIFSLFFLAKEITLETNGCILVTLFSPGPFCTHSYVLSNGV
jgi:hypothetical protein